MHRCGRRGCHCGVDGGGGGGASSWWWWWWWCVVVVVVVVVRRGGGGGGMGRGGLGLCWVVRLNEPNVGSGLVTRPVT